MIHDSPCLSLPSKGQKGRVRLPVLTSKCSSHFATLSLTESHASGLQPDVGRGQEQMLFCNSLYSGRPSHGPSDTSHGFKADRRWSDPLFKNCNRNLPLRYLTGMWPVHMLKALPDQTWKDLPYVRWGRAFGLFPYVPSTDHWFSLGPLDLFYTTWTTEKPWIFTDTFVSVAYSYGMESPRE